MITRPEESYQLWCVVVCDLETTRMVYVGTLRHGGKICIVEHTNSIEPSPSPSWESNGSSAGQEIPEDSLHCLQEPATCPYPDPDQ
jgi:hypothetical protein